MRSDPKRMYGLPTPAIFEFAKRVLRIIIWNKKRKIRTIEVGIVDIFNEVMTGFLSLLYVS